MSELIGKVQKNSLESVNVCLSSFKGKIYVDFRIWYREDASKSEEKPTQKGLCLSADVLEEVLPLLQKALAAIQGKG